MNQGDVYSVVIRLCFHSIATLMIRTCLLICLLLGGVTTTAAQGVSPGEVSRELLATYKNLDLDRTAQLMHPEALGRLQAMVVEIASLDSTGSMAMMFSGETDPQTIADLYPEEAFVRFMTAIIEVQPEIGQALRNLEAEMLGHVIEGDSLAHVVTRNRISMMGIEMHQMEVISLKRHGEGWLALLSGDISNMAEAVRARLRGEGSQ